MTMTDERTPEEIERNIESTRASLKETLTELEHRLSPGHRMHEMRQRINPESMLPWAAVGAVATGAVLAIRGFRRHSSSYFDGDDMDDAVCFDAPIPSDVVR
jgi:uncharacterized protein DUF3618